MVMRQVQLDRIDYVASTSKTIDIPREHFLKRLTLELDGQCDSGSAVSRSAYNPFEVISRIEVVTNGQTIKSISGSMLYLQNILEHGAIPPRTQTPSSTSQSNQAFGGALRLFFDKDKDLVETLLPSHKLSSLQLRITFATAATIDSGSGFAIDYLYVRPMLTYEDNRGQTTTGIGVLKETEYVKTLTQTGWAELELPVGNVYHSLALLARNNGAASNTVIDEYEVVLNGIVVVRKVRFAASRAEDLLDYSLEAANQPTGFTMVDFDLGGSAPIDTRGQSSFKLRYNVAATPSGTADLTVVAEELIPPSA